MNKEIIKERLRNDALYDMIMEADEASRIVKDGMAVGVSGFTPSGYPKAVTLALAERVKREKEKLM